MKKEIIEFKNFDLETVEDMINALMEVPKGYTLHPLGQKCAMAIDNYNECIYLDDPNWIECLDEEFEEDIKENGDWDGEVDDDKLVTYKESVFNHGYDDGVADTMNNLELYVVMGYIDLCQNGNTEAVLQGVFSTEELARECGDELVECGNIEYYEIECPKLDEFG